MFRSRDERLAHARELGKALIEAAVRYSKVAYKDETTQTRFVNEFLVMCDMGFCCLIAGDTVVGNDLSAEIGEEFDRFNAEHSELFIERQQAYSALIDARKPDVLHKLAAAMAGYVGNSAPVISWATKEFGRSIMIYSELIAPEAIREHCLWGCS